MIQILKNGLQLKLKRNISYGELGGDSVMISLNAMNFKL